MFYAHSCLWSGGRGRLLYVLWRPVNGRSRQTTAYQGRLTPFSCTVETLHKNYLQLTGELNGEHIPAPGYNRTNHVTPGYHLVRWFSPCYDARPGAFLAGVAAVLDVSLCPINVGFRRFVGSPCVFWRAKDRSIRPSTRTPSTLAINKATSYVPCSNSIRKYRGCYPSL